MSSLWAESTAALLDDESKRIASEAMARYGDGARIALMEASRDAESMITKRIYMRSANLISLASKESTCCDIIKRDE